jgi:hypothetical protein
MHMDKSKLHIMHSFRTPSGSTSGLENREHWYSRGRMEVKEGRTRENGKSVKQISYFSAFSVIHAV